MYKDIHPFGVRFPTEIREKIEKSAAENHRSMNAEIVAGMVERYKEKTGLYDFSDGELIDELLRRYGPDRIFIKIGNQDLEGE